MTEPLQPVGQALFHDNAEVELITPEELSEEALVEAVKGVEGIAVRSAKLTETELAAATDLRAVSRHGVGSVSYTHLTLPTKRIV